MTDNTTETTLPRSKRSLKREKIYMESLTTEQLLLVHDRHRFWSHQVWRNKQERSHAGLIADDVAAEIKRRNMEATRETNTQEKST